jgi:spermidine/putrescine transport system substrate-binding protein
MKQQLLSFTTRFFIVIAWISLFFLFLWLPQFSQKFSFSKSITVLAWPTLIDTQKLAEFEQKSGIKVYVRYFESNEELYAKMKETKGAGYDLIMPSDYMINQMAQEGLLKKINTSKLHFLSDLYPHLVGNYFDPHNEYSVPFFWSIYGIAIDKDHFKNEMPPKSWKLVFDPAVAQPHTSMIDDAREAILIAAKYLYGSPSSLSPEQLRKVSELLQQQKQWIEVYTEDRANYLLASKACPVAVILGAVVSRIMKEFKNIAFIIPEEGTFMVIDSFAMPITSDKDELVYEFLNYMYRSEVISYYIQKFGYFSPIKSVSNAQSVIEMPSEEQLKNTEFFKNIISKKEISDIWIQLKA